MAQEFEVTITETLRKTVTVEAADQHEAEQLVSDAWHNSEYILDADNFIGAAFEATIGNGSFIDDADKMADFEILSKAEFLASYSYLTEAEYDTTAALVKQRAALIESIAKKHLRVATLEKRRSDTLDFYDCSVWGIKSALEAAYKAGREANS